MLYFLKFRPIIIIITTIIISYFYIKFISSILADVTNPECIELSDKITSIYFPFIGNRNIECKSMSLNEIGDYFAGLIAFLSTFWLVVAFIWQAQELSFQRREFQITNELAKSRQDQEMFWKKIDTARNAYMDARNSINELSKIYAEINLEEFQNDLYSANDIISAAEYFPNDEKIEAYRTGFNSTLIDQYKDRYIQTMSYFYIIYEVCKDPETLKFLPFNNVKIDDLNSS